jgi:Nucleotide-diphospho-sugar transferase
MAPSSSSTSTSVAATTTTTTTRVLLAHLFGAVIAFQLGLFYNVQRGERGLSSGCPYKRTRSSEWFSPKEYLDSYHRSAPPSSLSVPHAITKHVVGAATVNVFEFVNAFRFGFSNFAMQNAQTSNYTKGNQHVLFLYQHPSSLPSTPGNSSSNVVAAAATLPVPGVTLVDATKRCRVVKHLLTNSGTTRDRNLHSCTAIIGQHSDSYHLSKWMHDDLNSSRVRGFRRVNRYEFVTSWKVFNGLLRIVPERTRSRESMKLLGEYLTALDDATDKLRPIAAKVAGAGSPSVQGNIIVLVCNFGHAELFVNFVCVARANGVDLAKMLLFATDEETYELATALGISVFHDARIFASIPRSASATYGNDQYAKIMMSKVYCVHMISMLGYNLLFQDVDIMIYKPNYLEWFIEKAASENFDIFFQHDFNDRAEYAPWYVLNSKVSLFMFVHGSDCCVCQGLQFGVLLRSQQRQHAATVCRNDLPGRQGERLSQPPGGTPHGHERVVEPARPPRQEPARRSREVSQYVPRLPALLYRAPVLRFFLPSTLLLPIVGWHFQRNKEFMRDMIQHGKSKQWSFHMNWNEHKDIKRQYLEQMGDWHLNPACTNATSWESLRLASSGAPSLTAACCSNDPLIRCNWRDKPSVIPCRDSPFYDKKKPTSFW